MTHYTAADLALAERHIAQGEQHIGQQERLLTTLATKGLPTAEAEKFLSLLYETQVEHRRHREGIVVALEEEKRASGLMRASRLSEVRSASFGNP